MKRLQRPLRGDSNSPGARRSRDYRSRDGAGIKVPGIPVLWDKFIAQLIDSKTLTAAEALDERNVIAVAAEHLADWHHASAREIAAVRLSSRVTRRGQKSG